jgi:hypothetical protein
MLAQQRMQRHGINIPRTRAEWQSSSIPSHQSFGGGVSFEKHDFGCTVIFPAGPVTMDFAEGGRLLGLRIEALLSFVGTETQEYGFCNLEALKAAIASAFDANSLQIGQSDLVFLSKNHSYT